MLVAVPTPATFSRLTTVMGYPASDRNKIQLGKNDNETSDNHSTSFNYAGLNKTQAPKAYHHMV